MSWDRAREEVVRLVRIKGFLGPAELRVLYDYAGKGPKNGEIVEIGSWLGLSTVFLAKGLKAGKRGGKVYAVDPHKNTATHLYMLPDGKMRCPQGTEREFRENIKRYGVDDVVVPMVMKSEDAAKGWNKPVRLLFVDGDHSYEGVKTDILCWVPHVLEGGVMIFDDYYGSPAGTVKKAMDDWLLGKNIIGNTYRVNRMLIGNKKGDM